MLCNASRLALWEECQWFPEVLDTVWSLLDFSPKLEYRIGAGLVKNANIIAVYTSGWMNYTKICPKKEHFQI